MPTDAQTQSAKPSKVARWAGWALTGLFGVFLLLDGVAKLFKPEPVVKGTVELGFSEDVIIPLGVVLIVSTILYLIPQTCVLGAILLTGYLGGAVATHVHAQHDAFRVLLPVIFGALIWLGLYLREPRLRVLAPIRQ
jgi:hypothetical protein